MKRKIIYLLMAIFIIIIAAIFVTSIKGVQVVDIFLVENQNSDAFKMSFNIPIETSKIKLAELEKDESIWIGEDRQQIDNSNCSVLEIILYDVHISDELRKDVSESSVSRAASLDVVQLGDGLEYIMAYPPDDSMTAIYLLIENRIVDMKGLNLDASLYLHELEIKVGKECANCFEPKFVSYTQNSYETVDEFKMVKRIVIDKTGSEEAYKEKIDMPYGDNVNAEWFGNINFSNEIKEGVLKQINEDTGVGHLYNRNPNDLDGFDVSLDAEQGEKAYLEYWFSGVETQGILKYSLLDVFGQVENFEIPVSAILFTDFIDVYSKAWQEKHEDQIEWDDQLDVFMNSLMIKDNDKILKMVGLTDFHLDFFYEDDKMKSDIREAYSFLNDFELTGYKILDSKPRQYDGMKYIVELEVSESNMEYIPNGNSIWDVEFGIDGPGVVQLFKRHDIEITHARFSDRNSPENFAYGVATYLQIFETIDDFNSIVPDWTSKEPYFDQFCFRMMKMLSDRFENGLVTAERLTEEVEKALGITDVDFTKHSHYDPETDSMSLRESGGSWMYESLVSLDFDEETGIHTVVLDFYTDAAFMLKAKTMKYEVMEMGIDGFRMISSELIYDSGCDPFMDNV